MRKIGIIAALALVLSFVVASTAFAASPHFTKNGIPEYTISGTTSDASRSVECSGELAGLGNGGFKCPDYSAGFLDVHL